MLYAFLVMLVAPFMAIFMPTKVVGKKYLKQIKGKGMLFSCNHQSMNDPILLKIKVNHKFKFIAKAELFKNKFSKKVLESLGAYPINRGESDIQAIKKTIQYLRDNKQIVIFPEGTRVKNGEGAEYKNGLAMRALKTDCYVVPAVFRKKTKMFVRNTLVIGKPFKFSDIDRFKDVKVNKDVLNEASEYLTELTNSLRKVDIKQYKKQVKEDTKNIQK